MTDVIQFVSDVCFSRVVIKRAIEVATGQIFFALKVHKQEAAIWYQHPSSSSTGQQNSQEQKFCEFFVLQVVNRAISVSSPK